jgi:hypothetical protein
MLYPIELWAPQWHYHTPVPRQLATPPSAPPAPPPAYNKAMISNPATLSVALKEWNLVISALLEGRQAILLRKGGILESGNQFELEHPAFLFYPTFIHQDPQMVKPADRAGLSQVAAEPESVTLRGYGTVARIFEVPSRRQLEALNDLHLWDAPLLDMRFNYRPEKPLYLVVVRAFALAAPVTVPNTLEYAGCKSWVPLNRDVDVRGATPALTRDQMEALVERIARTFSPAAPVPPVPAGGHGLGLSKPGSSGL